MDVVQYTNLHILTHVAIESDLPSILPRVFYYGRLKLNFLLNKFFSKLKKTARESGDDEETERTNE